MMEQIEVSFRQEAPDTAIVAPLQNLFEPLAVEMLTKYKQLVKQNYKNIVLDLTQVEAISAAGLGMLRYLLDQVAERKGQMPLACRSEKVLKLLKISGLLGQLKVSNTAEEALAQLLKEAK